MANNKQPPSTATALDGEEIQRTLPTVSEPPKNANHVDGVIDKDRRDVLKEWSKFKRMMPRSGRDRGLSRLKRSLGTLLKLSEIITDQGTQSRVGIDQEIVAEYADHMKMGDQFPLVVVFKDGCKYYLADGFHRVLAAGKAGCTDIAADIRPGTLLNAIRYSIGTNQRHGLRRTNADKLHCIALALQHFSEESNHSIAEMCGVSHEYVRRHREQLATVANSTTPAAAPEETAPLLPAELVRPAKRTGRDGKKYSVRKIKRGPMIDVTAEETTTRPAEPAPDHAPDYIPSNGLMYADTAIEQLKKIQPQDTQREDGFDTVVAWIEAHRDQGDGDEVPHIKTAAEVLSQPDSGDSDSRNLRLLKREWRKTCKRDRSAFLQWIQEAAA